MTLSKRVFPVAKICVKNNLPPHLLLSLGLLTGAFLIMWPCYWERDDTLFFFLTFLPLTGILLLTPLFLPEQDRDTLDVIRMRATPLALIFSVRAVCGILFLLALPAGALLVLSLLHCEISSGLWSEAVSCSLFLGGLGALCYALWENLPAAYLVPVLYFILCNMTGRERMKEWGLEAFCIAPNGQDYIPGLRPALLVGGLLLLLAAILLRCRRKRNG